MKLNIGVEAYINLKMPIRKVNINTLERFLETTIRCHLKRMSIVLLLKSNLERIGKYLSDDLLFLPRSQLFDETSMGGSSDASG